MKGLRHQFAKIKGGANQSLWQKLISKMFIFYYLLNEQFLNVQKFLDFCVNKEVKKNLSWAILILTFQ